jgi:hypothetical protein
MQYIGYLLPHTYVTNIISGSISGNVIFNIGYLSQGLNGYAAANVFVPVGVLGIMSVVDQRTFK